MRGQFYLPISVSARLSILELSAVAANNLEQHAKMLHGGLAVGQRIEFARRTPKSPIHSEVIDEVSGVASVPFVVFVSRVMALYHLPAANPDETVEKYAERLRSISLVRADRAYESQMKRTRASQAV